MSLSRYARIIKSRPPGEQRQKTPKKAPRYWKSIENQRRLFDKLVGPQLNIKNAQDWYNVTSRDVLSKNGSSALLQYNNSVQSALKKIYPETHWEKKKFKQKEWHRFSKLIDPIKDKANSYYRTHFERIAERKGIKTLDQFYDIGNTALANEGVTFILKKFRQPHILFKNVFPYYRWNKDKFRQQAIDRKPPYYWSKRDNVSCFVDQVERKLNIKKYSDWYRISRPQIQALGGGGLLSSWPQTLMSFYPESSWNVSSFFMTDKKAIQRSLFNCVCEIYPTHDIFEEYRPGVKRDTLEEWITIDVFIPHLSIGLEYHGEQHYKDVIQRFDPVSIQEKRDAEKVQLCSSLGISIVVIPYWWKPGDKESIIASIENQSKKHFMLDAPLTRSQRLLEGSDDGRNTIHMNCVELRAFQA